MRLLPILFLAATGSCFADATAVFLGNAGGYAENVKAQFSTNSLGNLMVQIWNFTPNPDNASQIVYSLDFSLSKVGGTPAIGSSSADLIQISSKGTYTNQGVQSLSAWTATSTTATDLKNITLSAQDGWPTQGIVGAPDAANKYSDADWSIWLTNPFAAQTATFTFSGLTGYNSSTLITDVRFGFGLTANANEVQAAVTNTSSKTVVGAVPEPATWALAIGAAGLLWFMRRRPVSS